MSIASSIAAEIANEQKDVWVKELESAIDNESWISVEILLDKMREFRFSE